MYIGDKNKQQRLKNRRALESSKVSEINNFFDVIYEHLSDLYEKVMDDEIDLTELQEQIKQKLK